MQHSTCFQDVLCHYASEHSNTGGTGTQWKLSRVPKSKLHTAFAEDAKLLKKGKFKNW